MEAYENNRRMFFIVIPAPYYVIPAQAGIHLFDSKELSYLVLISGKFWIA